MRSIKKTTTTTRSPPVSHRFNDIAPDLSVINGRAESGGFPFAVSRRYAVRSYVDEPPGDGHSSCTVALPWRDGSGDIILAIAHRSRRSGEFTSFACRSRRGQEARHQFPDHLGLCPGSHVGIEMAP